MRMTLIVDTNPIFIVAAESPDEFPPPAASHCCHQGRTKKQRVPDSSSGMMTSRHNLKRDPSTGMTYIAGIMIEMLIIDLIAE